MSDHYTDLLSAYADDELDESTTREVEGHLAECASCRSTLDDLRRVVHAAAGYQGTGPSRDLWPAIQGEIDRSRVIQFPRARSTGRFRLRDLVAAGIVMAAAGAGGAWYLTRTSTVPETRTTVAAAPEETGFVSAAYDSASVELTRTLNANRDRLDTSTVRVLEQSIRTIDEAVAEARAAIQRDSANAYLNGQIAANLKKKVNLLKAATRAIHSET